ncbi:MAG: helix-turn-helix transcriptional regulator [Pseudomonadota bacterium]
MQDGSAPETPVYLTTKEVAELLRVKERKVYDLAAEGDIPHRRITGKLLFPRAALLAWVNGPDGMAKTRPDVVAGSHDPLLDWAIRESGCGLATLFNGSLDGLDRYMAGDAALSGLHMPETDGWNRNTVAERKPSNAVLIGWAIRRRGLLLSPRVHAMIRTIADLRGHRIALRQPGAGASTLLVKMLAEAGLHPGDVTPTRTMAYTEGEAAAAVASGEADAALGLEPFATQYGLGFLPLTDEYFDLLIDRRAYFTNSIQILMHFTSSDAFAERAAAMGGYDLSPVRTVRWLSD